MRKDGKKLKKVYILLAKNTTLEQPQKELLVPEFTKGLNYLEQLTAIAGICDSPKAPYLYRFDLEFSLVKYIKGRCNMWSCPECAINNTKKWIGRIIDGCNNLEADNWYLATITAHRYWRGEKSLINLRANWSKLRKRMARTVQKQNEELFYARVWEHHLDASYHMHLITNAQVSTKWLKDNAAVCGLGYQAKMGKPINAGIAGGYVAKYMLKQSQEDTLHSYPKGARRIECSQNWVAWLSDDSEDEWFYAGTLHQAAHNAEYHKMAGLRVFDSAIKDSLKRR
jgi:hypothetical protein